MLESVESELKDATWIIIAHRLNTIKNVDQKIRLNLGRIFKDVDDEY